MADVVEALLAHPALAELPLPVGFHHLSPQLQGMAHDGAWRRALAVAHGPLVELLPQGAAADALVAGTHVDTKCCSGVKADRRGYGDSASVPFSHNEYLLAKRHDLVFSVYHAVEEVSYHLLDVRFSALKARGLVQLYPEGTRSLCKETGKEEPPWSFDLLVLDPTLHQLLRRVR